MNFFRPFFEEGHHEFQGGICVKIIDRHVGKDRINESFWQLKLDPFNTRGLNAKQVETQFHLFSSYSISIGLTYSPFLFLHY